MEEQGGKEERVQWEWISNDRRGAWRVTCTNAKRCKCPKPLTLAQHCCCCSSSVGVWDYGKKILILDALITPEFIRILIP